LDIRIEWAARLQLNRAKGNEYYEVDLERVPDTSGIYVFARQWGKTYEALYVGKADNIRRRMKTQLNNLRLMHHVKSARSGSRVLLAATIRPKPGQRLPKLMQIVERALIRHFLGEAHDLVNKQGTRIDRHTIEVYGRKPRGLVGQKLFVEA
jgi:hypothetical protein